jgi:molybdopterin-guanine dinucleotide biosynthesis protein A
VTDANDGTAPPIRGAILAGGTARRFGGDPKGLVHLGAHTLLERVYGVVRQWDESPLLVANNPTAASERLVTTPDRRPGTGSLGGLYTALAETRAVTMVVAWDMPFLSGELLTALAASWHPNVDAVLPASEGPLGLEPLCGIYAPSCIPAIEHALDRGAYRMTAFHDEVRIDVMPLARVRTFGDPARMFFNVNTPEDLERARAVLEGDGAAHP